jgi:hypothetical protein
MHGWNAAVVATPVALASAAVLLWRRTLGPLPRWRRQQTRLRRQLVLEDDLDWCAQGFGNQRCMRCRNPRAPSRVSFR